MKAGLRLRAGASGMGSASAASSKPHANVPHSHHSWYLTLQNQKNPVYRYRKAQNPHQTLDALHL